MTMRIFLFRSLRVWTKTDIRDWNVNIVLTKSGKMLLTDFRQN